jgi:hypothetical protein
MMMPGHGLTAALVPFSLIVVCFTDNKEGYSCYNIKATDEEDDCVEEKTD